MTRNSSPPKRPTVSDGPDACGQSLGDGGEDEVADLVAQLVVHQLEIVDVDEQHGHERSPGAAPGPGVGEPVADEHPVGRAGERVVDDLVRQLGTQGALGFIEPGVGDGDGGVLGERATRPAGRARCRCGPAPRSG